MSVSVRVAGQRAADGKLAAMATMKLECDRLNLTYPPELVDYFEGTDALDFNNLDAIKREATEMDLKYDFKKIPGITSGEVEYGDGMVVDLEKLPEDIIRLRIYMS